MSYILIVWFMNLGHGTGRGEAVEYTAPAPLGRFASSEQCVAALQAWTDSTPRDRGWIFAEGQCLKTALPPERHLAEEWQGWLEAPLPEIKR